MNPVPKKAWIDEIAFMTTVFPESDTICWPIKPAVTSSQEKFNFEKLIMA